VANDGDLCVHSAVQGPLTLQMRRAPEKTECRPVSELSATGLMSPRRCPVARSLFFAGQTGKPAFEALTTPHPSRTLHDRARVTGKVQAIARKRYILATSPAMPFFV